MATASPGLTNLTTILFFVVYRAFALNDQKKSGTRESIKTVLTTVKIPWTGMKTLSL